MKSTLCAALAVAAIVVVGGIARADGTGDPAGVKSEGGKYFDKDGKPTFHIAKMGRSTKRSASVATRSAVCLSFDHDFSAASGGRPVHMEPVDSWHLDPSAR